MSKKILSTEEKSAEEMFHELGFDIDIYTLGIIRYSKYEDGIWYYIRFYEPIEEEEQFSCNTVINNRPQPLYINSKLLQAINKQMEELRKKRFKNEAYTVKQD